MTDGILPNRVIIDPIDPHAHWELANDGYDVTNFYCRASDQHGHDTTMTVKLSPQMSNILKAVAHDDRLPYKGSVHAVIRDAVQHRIRWIREQEKLGVQLWAPSDAERMRDDMAREKELDDHRRRLITETRERVRELAQMGHKAEAHNWIDRLEDVAYGYTDPRHKAEALQATVDLEKFLADFAPLKVVDRHDLPTETDHAHIPTEVAR